MNIKRNTLYNIIILAVLVLTLWMIGPFLLTLILAAIIAYTLLPVYNRITKTGLNKRVIENAVTCIQ